MSNKELVERLRRYHGKADAIKAADRIEALEVENARLRKALQMISIVEQGAGGNLTFQEMAKSAMQQARKALEPKP